jgi:hypothetical protein
LAAKLAAFESVAFAAAARAAAEAVLGCLGSLGSLGAFSGLGSFGSRLTLGFLGSQGGQERPEGEGSCLGCAFTGGAIGGMATWSFMPGCMPSGTRMRTRRPSGASKSRGMPEATPSGMVIPK